MADVNPLDTVVTLLKDNYTSANTDDITPAIAIIYEKPTDKEPRPGEDMIFVYSESGTKVPVGIGLPARAEVTDVVKIDIRSKPSNATQDAKVNDDHARKVLGETYRVIYANILNPGSGYSNIDPNIEEVDLSNGMRGVFRYVIKVRLIDYNRDMTA
jgi:hypothetical protein